MILFRYVLKEFLKFVFGTVVLCLFLFILFDFIHKTTNYFAKFEPSAGLIFKFYMYQIPFQLVQIFPIASLLASVITMVLLSRTNEVTAMRAAGMSPVKIGMPLAAGGIMLTLSSVFLGELVVPVTAKKMHYVTSVLIEGDDAFATDKSAHWVRKNNRVFHFDNYDHNSRSLVGLKLVTISERSFVPGSAIHAASAQYLPGEKTWLLRGIRYIHLDGGEVTGVTHSRDTKLSLPVDPEKLNAERRLPDEMSLVELGDLISSGSSAGADVLDYRIAWHVKLAYPLAAFLISLIGIQFGYRSERTTETVKSILLAFAMGISYWFILSASRALAGAGDLPPFLAGWLANIVICMIVGLQIWRVYRI